MDVLSIVLGAGTVIGGGSGVFMWMETRGSKYKEKRAAERAEEIKSALVPIQSDIQSIHAKLDADSAHASVVMKAAITDALEPLKDQISTLSTKVDPLWKALEAMAVAQVQVLHQPDPRRAEIDGLLEELHAELEGGPLMDTGRYVRLRSYLTQIKSWEPGVLLDFPVLPGEPTSAGILLSIMGLSREKRKQERMSS